MQLTPTQEQLDIIMYEVSQYLNKFKNVYTKEMDDCGVITGVNGYKFIVTWAYGSDAECKTELYASDLIKC